MQRLKVLSILLLLGIILPVHSQEVERDSLRKHMFSVGAIGSFEYQEFATPWKGTGLEKGVELRSDLALGDAGSGLALGVSGFHRTYFWKERQRESQGLGDLIYGLQGGYFTRVHPFRWSPRIEGGLSKLRFEYRYGFLISSLSPDQHKFHALRAAFHHARPLNGRLWLDMGLSVLYLDQWPGIWGTLGRGVGGGLSLALMIRTGEKGKYP